MTDEQLGRDFLDNGEKILNLCKMIDSFKVRPNIGLKKKVNEDNPKESYPSSNYTSIKQLLDDFLKAVNNDDPDELEKKVKNMKIYVTKMFSAYGDDPSEIYKILNKILHTASHYTNDKWRFENYLDHYYEFVAALDQYRFKGPLKKVFDKLGSEVQCMYQDGFFNLNKQSINELWDYPKQLNSLKTRVISERPDLFERYKKTLQDMNRFLSLIITLQPIEKENKTLFHKEYIKEIANAYSIFSTSYSEFLTAFDNPNTKQDEIRAPP